MSGLFLCPLKINRDVINFEGSLKMRKTAIIIICIFLLFICFLLILSGCESIRRAPTQDQKQIALNTYQAASAIEARGTDPQSPAAKQVVEGSTVALTYTGLPANPVIDDYPTTLGLASSDAAARPTIDEVLGSVEGGLSLAAELAILFGVGGAGVAGTKVAKWIKVARQKNQALKEIISGNEQFKHWLDTQTSNTMWASFKDIQKKSQSASTATLVTELKH